MIGWKKNRPVRLSQIIIHSIYILLSLLIITTTLFFYGFLNDKIIFTIIFISLVLFGFVGSRNALLISLSFLAATLLISLFLNVSGLENRIYYRPYEVLTIFNKKLGFYTFKPNAYLEMFVPFGDIYAIGTRKDIDKEPHQIIFKTDSLGFRNDADYQGEEYLLIGDSLLAGIDDTQEDILPSQLKRFQINTYALGHSGGIREYVQYITYMRHRFGNNFQALIFLFEGNDFPEKFKAAGPPKRDNPVSRYFRQYKAFFKETNVYRYTFSLYQRFFKKKWESEVLEINNNRMGFLTDHIKVSQRKHYDLPEDLAGMLAAVKENIGHIFFIPTKYRVYYPLAHQDQAASLPHAQWEAVAKLGQRLNIGCTDLTGPLLEASRRLSQDNRFTYWKDDTHWNKWGIAVAAQVIAGKMQNGEIKIIVAGGPGK